ncbi:MAG: hypothetical protein IT359_13240 [Gemmatimonadaceae bacterium]|nr:hypothetical protein [Gemmatimonadaceae bacterium]
MERRLAMPQKHTPTSHDVVLPNRPTPSHDVEPVADPTSSSERLVSYDHAVIHLDRGLERLSPARIAEIRMRLETGVYNSPDVIGELAMRLLESGDLDRY